MFLGLQPDHGHFAVILQLIASWDLVLGLAILLGALRSRRLDSWQRFATERDRIFGLIAARRINGVILITGDRHRSVRSPKRSLTEARRHGDG
ncbi:MAG: hypothetical protein PF961_15970 [Planctomycetota bacterium]|jgi:phosphodiesterase/alkaline phosphatase D-like protein|nr:hypothetical protein [Planctomycetota bacterium]